MKMRNTTSWRNVNNWHWVDKNCLSWADEYVKSQFGAIKVEQDGLVGAITGVTSVTGIADLNQRKGKVICVYDLQVKGTWKVTGADSETSGTFHIPELSYETGNNKIEVEFIPGASSESIPEHAAFLKTHITEKMKDKLSNFVEDMKKMNYGDVFIDEDATTPKTLKSYNPDSKIIENKSKEENAKPETIHTCSISHSIEFCAAPMNIYECLTAADNIAAWTRCQPTINPIVDGEFSFFDGAITGKFLKLVPGELIVQTWRLRSWPKNIHSKVTMNFSPNDVGVMVKITHEGIPSSEKSAVSGNWNAFYWHPIRDTFGYGCPSNYD